MTVGAGLDLTDFFGPVPSASISTPWHPSTTADVHLTVSRSASAADLAGPGLILEVGAAAAVGVSFQAVFLGTNAFREEGDAADSDAIDLEEELRTRQGEVEGASAWSDLIDFLLELLAPQGVAFLAGTSFGVGECGVSALFAVYNADPIGSQWDTIDEADLEGSGDESEEGSENG
jgi:hypothetical protein